MLECVLKYLYISSVSVLFIIQSAESKGFKLAGCFKSLNLKFILFKFLFQRFQSGSLCFPHLKSVKVAELFTLILLLYSCLCFRNSLQFRGAH
mmetsp:Transcript_17092/g.19450  ORF Transcript_17092/g.19450 Transcript_17092/m.19450 type:complete len:93 (-) Transcript_17092:735-1013(-)